MYPILSVISQLRSEDASVQVRYVGSPSGIEAILATKAQLPFESVSTASLRGSAPWALPYRLGKLAWGTAQSVRVVDRFSPQVLLATGGYVCAPAVVAAWLRGVPSVLHLPDLAPGLAIRLLSRFATHVAVSFAVSKSFFGPRKAVVTGYPVRRELFEADKSASRQRLGLDQREKTLLILGGSQGAHSINLAVSDALTELLKICQLVHLSGERDQPWLAAQRNSLPQSLAAKYSLHPYLHEEMIDALAAADLAVARAGAATTAEFPALGLPSILIPYPHAGRHQELNADYMVERKAALRVGDSELKKGILLRTVADLFEDQQKLGNLAEGARRLAKPEAALQIARLLRETALID